MDLIDTSRVNYNVIIIIVITNRRTKHWYCYGRNLTDIHDDDDGDSNEKQKLTEWLRLTDTITSNNVACLLKD